MAKNSEYLRRMWGTDLAASSEPCFLKASCGVQKRLAFLALWGLLIRLIDDRPWAEGNPLVQLSSPPSAFL